jgi:hypothetical protein
VAGGGLREVDPRAFDDSARELDELGVQVLGPDDCLQDDGAAAAVLSPHADRPSEGDELVADQPHVALA